MSSLETGKERIHFVHPLLYQDMHPVNIGVAGCGGTGTMIIRELARMDIALRGLGKQGLHIIAYDPDEVSESNIGRQLFSESDIGQNKAEALISRTNRVYGTQWIGISRKFSGQSSQSHVPNPTIVITATDTVESRSQMMASFAGVNKIDNLGGFLYWIDSGNGNNFGQVCIGTTKKIKQPESDIYETVAKLPTPEYLYEGKVDEHHEPSCSLAQALGKQDLLVNSFMAQIVCQHLWSMLRYSNISTRGAFLNLQTMIMRPIKI